MFCSLIVLFSFAAPSHAEPQEQPAMLEATIGGAGYNGGWTTLSPDPSQLAWDANPSKSFPHFRAGWLNVPVLQDPYIVTYEKSPRMCLRVLMKPAAKQPAKLGPILLHCGGPGSDASCATIWGKWFELNSTYLVGPPLSDDYDYWSISQRGMVQDLESKGFNSSCPFKDEHGNAIREWPAVECNGIDNLLKHGGVEEVLKRMDGNPDVNTWQMIDEIRKGPDAQTFGVPYFNETYVRWAYRVTALEHNLCIHDPKYQFVSPVTNRSFNLFHYVGTSYLAGDIEVFRNAIGAQKMSIYGVSYGTKVGSVYATEFPDKVHRLILDGDMGSDPDVRVFAESWGQAPEEVWTGIAESCDNSVMAPDLSPQTMCPAGPGVNAKLQKLLKNAVTEKEKNNALSLFQKLRSVIYRPGAVGAPELMKCIADLYKTGQKGPSCGISTKNWPGTWALAPRGAAVFGAVLGMDLAGRLTEEGVIEWWRRTKETQPLGITRSLANVILVASWPAIPRPQPPAGDSKVAPLVIGNLHDPQTPYKNAQRMIVAFPSGRLLTTQFYGHGLQGPHNVTAVVEQYEEELRKGLLPKYTDDVAKLLCVKVVLEYLKYGTSAILRDHVCNAAGPIPTWAGTTMMSPRAAATTVMI